MTKSPKLRVLASQPELDPHVDEPGPPGSLPDLRLRRPDDASQTRDTSGRSGEPGGELDRRQLMKLLAAGAGLAGVGSLAGCMERPTERIMPRVEQPPELVPGVPLEYATAMVVDGFATGLAVKTLEARPIKVEGNPEHPASLGATNALHQASVLELYDPNRARSALEGGVPATRDRLLRMIARRAAMPDLWFLMYPQSSPVLVDLMARVRARHPGARFAFYAPLERRQVYEGARRAFGQPLEAQYRFARADVIVSLDADFTAATPNSVRWSRDFASRRRLARPSDDMSRLYVAEPRPSPTGTLADHHLPVRPSQIARLAGGLVRAIQDRPTGLGGREQRWVRSAAEDLLGRRGRGLVIVGDRQGAEVHAAVHAINAAIGAVGSTVEYTEPALIEPLGDGLPELATAIRAGRVQTLVIVEANPIYTAPPEVDFAGLLARVPETWCAAVEPHETARQCRWFLPLAHFMESWGDARAYDGTISLIQPLIRPLHGGLSLLELVATFTGDEHPDAHRMVRERYALADDAGQLGWQQLLQRGFIPNTQEPVVSTTPPRLADVPVVETTGFELAFDVSAAVYDGRFANNAWLQELPKPHEKITWGNAAVISPATAEELRLEHGRVVRIRRGTWDLELPVYIQPGHADRCASVELGYGRTAGGPIANGVGGNAYRLRTLASPGHDRVELVRTGRRGELAVTQQHFDQHGRAIAIAADLAHYRANPELTAALRGPLPTWLPEHFEGVPAWGMSIDTMICTGCSACVIACQAENNIPVVGREGVIRNREMHWLRIDTYREDHGDRVEYVHQPMLCQHCEKAPCEYVCPVYATQHSPDGLNEMVYNRCIGTRFCSNNCPYKVRRFNWFDYTEDTPRTQRLQFNPSVTVRARGVMEKCTYCVQRIRGAEIAARKERREIRPGEVMTACQQACPTGAIQFGLLSHDQTDVVRWRNEARSYAVLHDLGTRPRTMYLAKLRNPRGDR
jgi:Fe-S-cluster-containing dehydrogenase component/anaerobic selenocysteine-containing dehydrogenase